MKLMNKKVFIVLLLILVAFYVLNVFTPLFSDDFMYKFIFDKNGVADPLKPITSFSDVLLSQWNHYLSYNGRTITHILVQTFLGLLNKNIFNVFNALILGIFLLLTSKYTFNRISARTISLIGSFCLLLLPSFDNCLLWLAGSINYLWTSAIVVAFLYFFERRKDRELRLWSILVFILSILSGWTHEAFTLPLAIALILTEWETLKQHREGCIMIVGLFIGAALCAFSPGTFLRATGGEVHGLLKTILVKLFYGAKIILQLKCIYLTIILLLLVKYKNKKTLKLILKENATIVLAIVFSLGIVVASGFNTTRTAFAAEMFCLFFALKLANEISIAIGNKHLLGYVAVILAIIVYSFVVYYSYLNYNESNSLETQLTLKKSYVISTNEVREPNIFKDYIQKELVDEDDEFYLSFSTKQFHNKYISSVYHRDSVVFLPKRFLIQCKDNAHKFDKINVHSDMPFYAIHLHDNEPHNVFYKLRSIKHDKEPFYKKMLPGLFSSLDANEIETNKWDVVNIGNERFLIVGKNEAINIRLTGIVIK